MINVEDYGFKVIARAPSAEIPEKDLRVLLRQRTKHYFCGLGSWVLELHDESMLISAYAKSGVKEVLGVRVFLSLDGTCTVKISWCRTSGACGRIESEEQGMPLDVDAVYCTVHQNFERLLDRVFSNAVLKTRSALHEDHSAFARKEMLKVVKEWKTA